MTRPRVARKNGTRLQQVRGPGVADLLDVVDVPIVVVGRELLIARFNKAAAAVLGLSPADMGRPFRDLAPAGWPRLEERCTQVMTGGGECRADLRDGDTWFVVRMSPYPAGGCRVTGIVMTFTNVTAFRACVDQAIFERECTKAILNTVADPLVVLSADQRIQSGNRSFYTMFGVSRDEAEGIPLHELAKGVFLVASLREQLNELLAGSQAFQPVEVEHVSTANGQRTLVLDARPLAFPGHAERRVLVTFQDITARKQAEAAKDQRSEDELRRSESFLVEAQRLSLTGSFSWKVATDEITWSEQLYRIFEFEPGTPVTIERIISRIHPDDVSMLHGRIERARAGGPHFEYPHRLLMPDGSVKYVNAIAHGSVDADGQLEYVGALQDVTQSRRAEEALRAAHSELTRVTRIMSLGTFTASIAHEVNQPLSGIITNASTCLRMLGTDPPNIEGARETARRTIRDGNRASEVISRLRAIYARREPTPELVDLNEAARAVVLLSLSDLQRNRVVLRTEFDPDLPLVTGDRVQLQQVVLNLIRNASDAMSAVDDRPREVLVRTQRDDDDGVHLSVQDAGVGFTADAADRLFGAFYTTKQEGMGMGLAVSRSIIESHHGRLWATLNQGPGATFAFSIPRDLKTPRPPAPKPS